MMRGMYAAISGLQAHQTMLDVTANNIANADTIGYKAQRSTFVDELAQQMRPASAANASNGGTNDMQVGLGVQVGSIDNMMGQGSAQSTGTSTDVGVQGEGFFVVGDSPGVAPSGANPTQNLPTTDYYTRAGNFTVNANGFLMTQAGEYVLGQAASGAAAAGPTTYIYIQPGSTNVAIGSNGAVTYTNPAGVQTPAGFLTLASFPNEPGLARQGGSLWAQTLASGGPTTGSPNQGTFGKTISGELEMSNVDLATEFTNMITAERGYQAQSRVITAGDQMLQTVVQMGQ